VCETVCSGIVVQNLAAAQRLKGCTIIKGVLEIQILGGCECINYYYHRHQFTIIIFHHSEFVNLDYR